MSDIGCPVHHAPVDPVPFLSNGNINFKAHDVGWIVCGFFSSIATVASFWLIWKHMTYYTCPQQQRHIIRMLLMVPIYAIISTLSYIFYTDAIYFATIRDCYEAVVITSFFYLLVQYVGDTTAEQHEVFRQVELKKWFWPLGSWKYRPTGLHFLWIMKIGILQYAILRPVCTLIAVGLQYYNLYCLESWQPYFGHIWISLIISISITIAMYNVIQIYLPISEELKPYKPVLKFLAIKCIVFLTFWQDSFLSLLVYFQAIKATRYFTTADVQVGLSALLVTFEMMIFGFVHIKAFTYLIYRPQDRARTTIRWKALLDVMDFRDWWYEMQHTTRYVKARSRGKDYTVVDDIRWQKYMHLEKAMGRDRLAHMTAEQEKSKKKQIKTYWRNEEGEDALKERQELIEEAQMIEDRTGSHFAACISFATRTFDDQIREGRNLEEGIPLNEEAQRADVRNREIQASSLPLLTYNSLPDAHPELTRYHQVYSDHINGIEAQQQDFDMICRSNGLRRDTSSGLDAWWRNFRDRLSGDGGDLEADAEEEAQEKTSMLAEAHCDVDKHIITAIPFEAGRVLYANKLDDCFANRGDSPLSLIMKGDAQTINTALTPPLRFSQPFLERQIRIVNEDATTAKQAFTTADLVVSFDKSRKEPSLTQEGPSIGNVSRNVPVLTRASSAVQSVNPSISIATSPTSADTAQVTKSLVCTGPKGKSIALVLPAPLSGSTVSASTPSVTETFTTARHSPSDARRTRRESKFDSRKVVFVESKGKGRVEDDPEAEPTRRAGYIVPGGESLNQAKAKQVKSSEETRQKGENVIIVESTSRSRFTNEGTKRMQPQSSHSPLVDESTILPQKGRSSRRAAQLHPSWLEQTHLAEVPSTSHDFIPLPAPSQMVHIDHRQDAFAAAVSANTPATKMSSRIALEQRNSHETREPAQHRSRHSIEVGSIMTRQDIINVRTPQPYYQQEPSNAIGSRLMPSRYSNAPQYTQPRYSTGTIPRSSAHVSYHRYTGEPMWLPFPQQTMPTRVERQRRQFEAPPGYQLDYID